MSQIIEITDLAAPEDAAATLALPDLEQASALLHRVIA